MATATVTPATGVALRKVFALLEDHFDASTGQYRGEHSDESIAKETGISVDAVKSYRKAAFGKLMPPTELHKAVRDLGELEKLFLQTESDIRQKLRELTARINNLQRKYD